VAQTLRHPSSAPPQTAPTIVAPAEAKASDETHNAVHAMVMVLMQLNEIVLSGRTFAVYGHTISSALNTGPFTQQRAFHSSPFAFLSFCTQAKHAPTPQIM